MILRALNVLRRNGLCSPSSCAQFPLTKAFTVVIVLRAGGVSGQTGFLAAGPAFPLRRSGATFPARPAGPDLRLTASSSRKFERVPHADPCRDCSPGQERDLPLSIGKHCGRQRLRLGTDLSERPSRRCGSETAQWNRLRSDEGRHAPVRRQVLGMPSGTLWREGRQPELLLTLLPSRGILHVRAACGRCPAAVRGFTPAKQLLVSGRRARVLLGHGSIDWALWQLRHSSESSAFICAQSALGELPAQVEELCPLC